MCLAPSNFVLGGVHVELLILLAVVVGFVWILAKIFGGKRSKKEPDKYVVIQERRTQVRNHVVKVPGKTKGRRK